MELDHNAYLPKTINIQVCSGFALLDLSTYWFFKRELDYMYRIIMGWYYNELFSNALYHALRHMVRKRKS
jgi:hypothetical protein